MKVLSYIHIWVIMLLLAACTTDEGPRNLPPLLTVDSADSIMRNSALLRGYVDDEGRGSVTTLHFLYGSSAETMLQSQDVISSKDDSGCYSIMLSGLKAGTEYFYCLEGGNGRSAVKSEIRRFVTKPNTQPGISDARILSKGPKSVLLAFTIVDDGGEQLKEYGCYLNNERIVASSVSADGLVKMRIANLQANSDYQLKGFASNALGETVSATIAFSTTDALMLGEPGELDLLISDDRYEYTNIAVSGYLNGDDIAMLRDMMGRDAMGNSTPGRLRSLNLADATIVEGGGSYAYSRYTQNDVVGYGMFADCSNVTDIVLPDGVVAVEREAYTDCSSLTSLVLPASVRSVVPSSGCTSLQKIEVVATNEYYTSVDGVLFNARGTEIAWFPLGKKGDYSLPVGVKTIGDYAFQYCNIQHFIIPDGVESIGMAAFQHSNVEEISLPSTLKNLATAIFQHCGKLKVVRIGNGMEMLSSYVFDGCPLTDIYIDAFYPPVCNENTFSSTTDIFSNCTLHVPASALQLYRNAKGWKQFHNIKTS